MSETSDCSVEKIPILSSLEILRLQSFEKVVLAQAVLHEQIAVLFIIIARMLNGNSFHDIYPNFVSVME